MEPLETLCDRSPATGVLPEPLRQLYGGDLAFPHLPGRPYVVANFVSTLDGIVSYGLPGQSGGGQVSGFNRQDAFVMGLLRACADIVMVGAGTLHGDPGHVRTAAYIFPEAASHYAELRRSLVKATAHPLNVIVSGSGRVDLFEATFQTPGLETLIVTSHAGRRRLESGYPGGLGAVQVREVGEGPTLSPRAILQLLYREFDGRLLLHEGGPRLFGQVLAAGLVDELFGTLAPRIAGRRRDGPALSLVEAESFLPAEAPAFELVSVKRGGEHLFLRWRARANR